MSFYQYLVAFYVMQQICHSDTLFQTNNGDATTSTWTSVSYTGAGSIIEPRASETYTQCPLTNTGNCLLIRAKGDGTHTSYVTKDINVEFYNSLHIRYDYFHNGQATDGVRECYFSYTCDSQPTPKIEDMLGESVANRVGDIDLSICDASVSPLHITFYCHAGLDNQNKVNEGNLWLDNVLLTGTLIPTSSPSKYPSKSPTAHPIPVGVTVETGSSGFTTYYEGNGPIIFLSQHGGDQTGSINERHDGCYTASGTPNCSWTNATCTPTTNKCTAKKFQDSDTKDIAQCLHSRTIFTENSKTITSSLIINELHRNRLDANRQQEEAAQGDTDALKAWNEIHKDDNTGFVWKAKTNAKVTSNCGFGIIFDIHGQGFNDYNHLSYRLTEKHLNYVDDKISAVGAYTSKTYYKKSSSIKWLIDNNRQTIDNDYADIVRGPHSLGSILEDKGPGYKIIPSDSIPNAIIPLATDSDFFYYSGGFSLKYHGSSYYNHVDDINQGDGKYYTPNTKSTNTVDVIQIEVNSAIRTDETKRDQFCTDLSDAIVEFVEYWYKTSDCNPPSSAMTNIENGDNNTNNHHSDSGNNERKYIQSIVIVACTIFIVSVCCISGMCMIRKKSNVKAYTGVNIVKDADKMHTNSIEMNQTDTIIKN